MRDRDAEHLAGTAVVGEGGLALLHTEVDPLASKLTGGVAQQGPRQQPRLLQNLEPIADAQHQPAAIREIGDRLHHRCEAGDGTAAQVVTIGKAAGKDHQIEAVEMLLAMIDVTHRLLEHVQQGVGAIPVAPGSREDDDAGPHDPPSPPSPTRGAGDSGCSSIR